MLNRLGATTPVEFPERRGSFVSLIQIATLDGFVFVFHMIALGTLPASLSAFMRDPLEWKVVIDQAVERSAAVRTFGWPGRMDQWEGFMDLRLLRSGSLLAMIATTFPVGCVRLASQDKASDRMNYTGSRGCRPLAMVLAPDYYPAQEATTLASDEG